MRMSAFGTKRHANASIRFVPHLVHQHVGRLNADPNHTRQQAIPMTVRGGGFPTSPLAFMPIGRMGPSLRSFAADAHDCIVVPVLGPTAYKVVARFNRARKRAPL